MNMNDKNLIFGVEFKAGRLDKAASDVAEKRNEDWTRSSVWHVQGRGF